MPQKRLERVMRKDEYPDQKMLKRISEAFEVSYVKLLRPTSDSSSTNHFDQQKDDNQVVLNDGTVILDAGANNG